MGELGLSVRGLARERDCHDDRPYFGQAPAHPAPWKLSRGAFLAARLLLAPERGITQGRPDARKAGKPGVTGTGA